MIDKNKYPKVLIGSPTSKIKSYCDLEYFTSIKSLTYPNYEIFMVDNSADGSYYKKLIETYNIKCEHVNPDDRPLRETMVICNNLIRKYFLENEFDFYLSLESDIIIQPIFLEYALSRMKSINADIITYPYFWGANDNQFLLIRYLEKKSEKNKIVKLNEVQLNFYEGFGFLDGKIKDIFHAGIGCQLIKRDVLEKIQYRLNTKEKDEIWNDDCHADTFFARDLFKNGIKNYLDTSIIVKHLQSSWDSVVDLF